MSVGSFPHGHFQLSQKGELLYTFMENGRTDILKRSLCQRG